MTKNKTSKNPVAASSTTDELKPCTIRADKTFTVSIRLHPLDRIALGFAFEQMNQTPEGILELFIRSGIDRSSSKVANEYDYSSLIHQIEYSEDDPSKLKRTPVFWA